MVIDYTNPYYKCTLDYIMQKYWENKTRAWADEREANIKRCQEILDEIGRRELDVT